jgi:hypothetical protein
MDMTVPELNNEAVEGSLSQLYDKREYNSKDGPVTSIELPKTRFEGVSMHHLRTLSSWSANKFTTMLNAAVSLDSNSQAAISLSKLTDIVQADIKKNTGIFRGFPKDLTKVIDCVSKKGKSFQIETCGRFIEHSDSFGSTVKFAFKTSAKEKEDAERSYDTVVRLYISKKVEGGRSADRKFLEKDDDKGAWAAVHPYKSISKIEECFSGAESLHADIVVVPTITYRSKGNASTNGAPNVELTLVVRNVLISKKEDTAAQTETDRVLYGSTGGGRAHFPTNDVFYKRVVATGGEHIVGEEARELGYTLYNVLKPNFQEKISTFVDNEAQLVVFKNNSYKDSRCTIDIKDAHGNPVLLTFVQPEDGGARGVEISLDGTSYDDRQAFVGDRDGLHAFKEQFADRELTCVKELALRYEDEEREGNFNEIGARIPQGLNLLMVLITRKIGAGLADLIMPPAEAKADKTKQMAKLRRMLQALMKKPAVFSYASPDNPDGIAMPPAKLHTLQQKRAIDAAAMEDDADGDADDADGSFVTTRQLLNLKMRGGKPGPNIDFLKSDQQTLTPGADCKLGTGYIDAAIIMAVHISIASDGGWKKAVESGRPCPIRDISMVKSVTNIIGISRLSSGTSRKDAVQIDKTTGEMHVDISGVSVKVDYADSDDDEVEPPPAKKARGSDKSEGDESEDYDLEVA